MFSIRRLLAVPIVALAAAAGGVPAPAPDDADRVVLRGNVAPLAVPDFDAGPSDPDLPLDRMVLVLARRAGADAALEELLAAQLDPGSPFYHRWLSPEEFGGRFGIGDGELRSVIDWLQENGFAIDEVARGKGWIDFSGTVAQVERAFGTPIREYDVAGERHHANAADPSIPRSLAPSVAGIVSLHDFRRRSHRIEAGGAPDFRDAFTQQILGPADFARIYGLEPLYAKGIDGTGRKIAIVGRVQIDPADVRQFRTLFGLPPADPTILLNGLDPGFWDTGEEQEADLDVQWSGGVAKGAQVTFVVSKSTASTDGVDLSAQYIVDHNLADVMSTSFGECESDLGEAGVAFYANVWAQAAAEGITSFVSSGDTGFAGCDLGTSREATGSGVSGLCTPLEVVCVGGTLFDDASSLSLYWQIKPDAATGRSALSYIPEIAWNESGTVPGGAKLWASGGGPSAVHAKPWWQKGPGVPSDRKRSVPDVALSAATHDGYYVVQHDKGSGTAVLGGTSASSPAMAGIMALIVQKTGERQGNANPAFYAIAAGDAGNSPPAFHDIVSGSNDVPGLPGFSCGTGYDRVTGLGSVDADVLASRWLTIAPPSSSGERLRVRPVVRAPPSPVLPTRGGP
jgi:pseudomonalisin